MKKAVLLGVLKLKHEVASNKCLLAAGLCRPHRQTYDLPGSGLHFTEHSGKGAGDPDAAAAGSRRSAKQI